jgi:hypothetical protein
MRRRLGVSLFLLVLFLPFLIASCSMVSPDDGNVRVVLRATAEPSFSMAGDDDREDGEDDDAEDADRRKGENFLSRLESANVTFASMLARNLDGQLIDLDLDLPHTIDLVALGAGQEVTFPAGTLPEGDYDQLVVVMTEVDATFKDGGAIALTPPGGGWTAIVRVDPFTVEDGETVTLALNLRLGRAFRWLDGSFRFFPEFEGSRH